MENPKWEVFENIWEALEGNMGDATVMNMRCNLMREIVMTMKTSSAAPKEISTRLEITETEAKALMSGKLSEFGLEKLVKMAILSGLSPRLIVTP